MLNSFTCNMTAQIERQCRKIDRVVVINDDAGESGGAASIARASIRVLRSFGVAITLLNGSEKPTDLADDSGIQVVSLRKPSLLQQKRGRAALRGLFDVSILRDVQDWIAKNDTPGTIYHLHNWHKVLSPSVFTALRPVADRVCMTAHDYFLACPNGGQFNYQKETGCDLAGMSSSCIQSHCDRRNYGHKLWRVVRQAIRQQVFDLRTSTATVVAVHEGMVPYLVAGGIAEASIRVIRNPVSPWRTCRVEAEENKSVFFIGRLEKDKGLDLVAAAARKLGLHLQVVGDGPLRHEILLNYPEVNLLGWRSRKEISDLIDTARLVIVPTRWRETFGLVTLEAIGSGVPVIVSKHALISTDVVRIGAGCSCDPYDVSELATVLERLINSDTMVSAMSKAGFTRWRELAPDLEQWGASLIELYCSKILNADAALVSR